MSWRKRLLVWGCNTPREAATFALERCMATPLESLGPCTRTEGCVLKDGHYGICIQPGMEVPVAVPRKYVVRVVLVRVPPRTRLFIEQLRYAGLVRVYKDADGGCVLDMLPPAHITDTESWAKSNAERMATFRINAVAAPAVG